MRRDPIQTLADTGLRVLQTVRHLAKPPVPEQPLGSYESHLRDPVLALSGLCDGLLQQLATAPLQEVPEDLHNEPESRFVRAPSPGFALPALSRAGAAKTSVSADGRDETAGSQRENQAEWPGAPGPGLDRASPFERSRRSVDHPAPSQDEPAGAAPHSDSPAPQLRPAMEEFDGRPAARQRAGSASGSRNVQHPVGSDVEPSGEGHGSETRPPRKAWPETGLTGSPALASDLPARVENGSARGAGEPDLPLPGSRLTGSTERLAAMLRSHVAQPEPVTGAAEGQSREGEHLLSSRQVDDERGAVDEPGRARPAGRAGMEEIMERLAEELETEFVRTYGRTGG
jgi:hypothetical protein